MPIYKSPLEKGILIIQFLVSACMCVCVISMGHKIKCLTWKEEKQLLFPPHPSQVIFPENTGFPKTSFPQLEALLPPRQKVRVTEDMDQVELKEFNPSEQNWRQHREAYEEDDGPGQRGRSAVPDGMTRPCAAWPGGD